MSALSAAQTEHDLLYRYANACAKARSVGLIVATNRVHYILRRASVLCR